MLPNNRKKKLKSLSARAFFIFVFNSPWHVSHVHEFVYLFVCRALLFRFISKKYILFFVFVDKLLTVKQIQHSFKYKKKKNWKQIKTEVVCHFNAINMKFTSYYMPNFHKY